MNCFAFYICFSIKKLFSALYFVSFVCDALDGWFAQKFNQVSTFGAVLDMVTDRISTACLLVILSQVYSNAQGRDLRSFPDSHSTDNKWSKAHNSRAVPQVLITSI
ncbi:probable CDP-diacylglycerol--inositol 3-phosphatidyltransferase 2 [Actinidia eriantha]|uniref:probable CDP-diacylglycerol--inositol 3-phosphatidyltransferase 2 n=1 Tax=Actinidia eriantha TaxID=165200 RepID=UPI00258CECD8|nr:probable CDP-diacylglycerol--inositol 3-phosphatidyltransferase 2 [Actinidia eriantha]